ILVEILQTMHESEYFSHGRRDMNFRFWITYQQTAKQNDNEFLECHNSNLDVQLIFI
ncbi:hypothetical protein M422DRAFT_140334, partial [Sphaerobolus stellatus SS14]